MQSIQHDILKGFWIGPMPVNVFFKEFMENARVPPAAALAEKDYFSSMPQAVSGNRVSQQLMEQKFLQLIREAATRSGAKLGTNMEFLIEINHGPKTPCDPFHLEPLFTVDEEIAKNDFVFLDTAGRFDYPGHIFDCKCPQFCRAGLAQRLQRWFNICPRTHGFVLHVGDPWARLIRIDRAGAVFTERFNIREDSSVLLSYIWRFSNMSVEESGLDSTVRAPNPQEIQLAKASLKHFADNCPGCDEPSLVIQVPDHKTGGMREVVSFWPSPSNPSCPMKLTGRATRAWPVYDLKSRQVVYFKESWRSLETGMHKESAILATLNKARIRHVPQLICGDDMDMKGEWFKTKSQLYQDAEWNLIATFYQLAPRMAHRFTVDLIGTHLENFGSTRNLLGAVYDAFIAHRDAYKICGILHCDISSNNILLDKTGRGVLNDWDMARTLDTLKDGDSSVGTWRFMSAALVSNPRKYNDVHDDIESFFYLVVYFLLRYARHNKSEKTTVESLILTIFDDPNGKLKMVETLTSDWDITQNEPMNQWIRRAGKAVEDWTDKWRRETDDRAGGKCMGDQDHSQSREKGRRSLKDHDYFVYLFDKFLRSKRYASAWPDPKDDGARDCLTLG